MVFRLSISASPVLGAYLVEPVRNWSAWKVRPQRKEKDVSAKVNNQMSRAEFDRLDGLEAEISTCWDKAALALAEIKRDKLYRSSREGRPQSWEQYCRKVHDWTPQWANQLIRRAEAVQTLRAKTETKVSVSKAQAGALVGPEPGEQTMLPFALPADGHEDKEDGVNDTLTGREKAMLDRLKNGTKNDETPKAPKAPDSYEVCVFVKDSNPFEQVLPQCWKGHGVIRSIVPAKDIQHVLEVLGQTLERQKPTKVRISITL